ncbi:MAG: hypothetical protein NTW96_02040 [Planctomycetia bacterium]|nr:hypothetical protein [Planctomycetia bacterium]
MASPTTAITRPEFAMSYAEFNLELSRLGFIGPQVFRPRLVGSQQGQIAVIPLKALLTTRDTSRAPWGAYNRANFTFDLTNYATAEHGVEEPIDDRELKMYLDLLDAENVHSSRAIDGILRAFEVAAATALYDLSTWTGAALQTDLSVEWDKPNTAGPIANIEAARQKVITGCGMIPNCLVLNRRQFHHLKNTDEIVDRVKYAGKVDPANITPSAVAAALDLDRIVVAGGYQNVANEAATPDIDPIWSDQYSMLCRAAVTDDPAEPCIGRTLLWSQENAGLGNAQELAVITEEYREEARRGAVIRARCDYTIKLLHKECGHLLGNVLTL